MPVFQYFGWVGSILLAALFATNWCCSVPIARAPLSDVPLDQKIHIRIHTDHKWPERVVLDTTRTTLAHDAKADGETDVAGSETAMLAERQSFGAFAEMAGISVRPCFRPPCPAGPAAEQADPRFGKAVPSQVRTRLAARKDPTFPSRFHKLPGRS